MYPARKNIWFDKLFTVYNRNLLKRRFAALYLDEDSSFTNRSKHLPTIVYANHSSWWDGLIVFQLAKIWRVEQFAMMDEKPFLKHRFHEKIGAFSVRRENPRDAVRAINYAVERLNEAENRVLFIFPQGEIAPNDARPLKLYQGLARIVEKCGICQTFPLALRFEQRNNFKPEIFIKIGAGQIFRAENDVSPRDLTANFAASLTETLEKTKDSIAGETTESFRKVL